MSPLGVLQVGAGVVSIGPHSVNLTLPNEGYCLLDNTNLADRKVLDILSLDHRNKVVLAFASCKELEMWRMGKIQYLTDYGFVLAPIVLLGQRLPMSLLPRFLESTEKGLEERGQKAWNNVRSDWLKTIAKHKIESKAGEALYLGVIGRDEEAIYTGTPHHSEAADGRRLLGLAAITII